MLDITIRIGPTLDKLSPISPYEPYVIDGHHFQGTIDIRLRGLNAAEYFDQNPNQSFCIHVHGCFLTPVSADDLLFGNQFDQPLCLPRGFFLLSKFAQWWDPGLDLHLDESRPYAYSPLIVTLNTLHIASSADNNNNNKVWCDPAAEINNQSIDFQENTQLIRPGKQTPLSSNERQYYFSDPEHRRQVSVQSDQVWIGDFCNSYLDMMNGSIKIPGFSVDVLKYYQGQATSTIHL